MPLYDLSERWLDDAPLDRTVEEPEEVAPTVLDTMAAAARQMSYSRALLDWSPAVSLYKRAFGVQPEPEPAPVSGYDVINDPQMKGREDYFDHVLWSESPQETYRTLQQITEQEMDEQVLQRAGWGGVVASLGTIASDPLVLMSMMIPVAPALPGATRAGRVLAGVASQAAVDTAGELALHRQQPLRTFGESAFNVGAGALLTGALGALVTKIPKSEFEPVRKELAKVLDVQRRSASAGSTVGASEVVETTLKDEEIATHAGKLLAATLGRISPVTRTMRSPFLKARVLAQKLSEFTPLLNKHLRGITPEESIDTLVKRVVNSGRYESVRLADEAFLEYRQTGGNLTRKQFMEAVSDAANMGDVSDIPGVAKVAQWARKVLDEDKTTLQQLGIDIDDHVLGAKSYFPHVHDIPKIIADRVNAEKILFESFRANPKIPAGGDITERARKRVSALTAKRWELKKQGLSDNSEKIVEVDKALVEAKEVLKARRGELRTDVSKAEANLEVAEKDAAKAAQALDQEVQRLKDTRKTAREAKRVAGSKRSTTRSLRQRAGGLAARLSALGEQLDTLKAFPDVSHEARLAELEKALETAVTTLKQRTADLTAARGATAPLAKEAARAAREAVSQQVALLRQEGRALRDELRRLKDAQQPVEELQAKLAQNTQAIEDAKRERIRATKQAVREARRPATDALNARRAAREDVWRLRAARNTAREASQDVGSARAKLAKKIEATTKRLKATEMSAAEARALSKAAKEAMVEARKLVREQKRATSKARKTSVRAKTTAGKAQIPQYDDAEIMEQVRATLDHIMHMPTGRVFTSAGAPSPLKSRILDIPYDLWKPYLVRDFEKVMAGYFRSVAPEILMRQKFGSTDLQKELDEVTEEAHRMIEGASPAEAHKINLKLEAVTQDLVGLRDRLLGHVGPTNQASYGGGSYWVRAGKILRTYAYVRSLGSQVFSSMSDPAKLIARYGTLNTMKATAKFLTDWNANKLSRAEANRMGTALSMNVDTKSHQVGDIVDELPLTRLEQGAQLTANTFTRLTLMAPWNSLIQNVTAILEQHALLHAAKGGKLSRVQRANMTRYGFTDKDFVRLRKAFDTWGEDQDGIFRARTDLWDPEYADLAQKVETAVVKAADEVLSVRGIGDLPLMMDKESVKTLLQFKSFAITSVNRTMIPFAQGLALRDARTAQGVLAAMTSGIMIYYLKELAAGYKPSTDPQRLLAEAFNWSGMMGYIPELWDPIASTVNLTSDETGEDLLPRFSRFKSRSVHESWAGPTYGSTLRLGQSLLRNWTNAELEQKDLTALKMMLPYRNWFPVTRLFNAMEGELGEALDAEGSTVKSFGERVMELEESR